MNKVWWKESVVYQVYPQSFYDTNDDGIGDIQGIIEKLDYLKDLGVDVIWVSPMLQSPLDDNGYDISDYRAINPMYGDLEDYKRLLSEAHQRGIKILLDLVVNHTSDEHPWFIESRKSKENEYRDYYVWREGKGDDVPNNWGSFFGGSTWQKDEATDMYYLHLFTKKQVDLNWENPKMRFEIYEMMKFWCDLGVDGFRMDVINFISKDQDFPDGKLMKDGMFGDLSEHSINGPRVHEFLQEMNQEVLSHYDVMTVGETAGVSVEDAKQYANAKGSELNMVFQFEHVKIGNGKLGKFTTDRFDFMEFKEVMTRWQVELHEKAWNSVYLGNHDQPRSLTRFGDDSKTYRQVSAKMLATFNLSLQGTPYIFQGEEIGMTNAYFDKIEYYKDVESLGYFKQYTSEGLISEAEMLKCLKLRSRDNARTPMHWSDKENAGFTTGTPWMRVIDNYDEINVASQLNDPNSVLNYYKEMIQVRKQNPTLIYGEFEPVDKLNTKVFSYFRKMENEVYFVACNFFDQKVEIEIPSCLNKEVLISNYGIQEVKETLVLQPYEAIIIK